MRGIVVKILDHLCIVGIIMAFATGVLGVMGVSEPLFTVLAGTLIGLLGGATNLVILLAILEVRRAVVMHYQVAIKVKVSQTADEKIYNPILIKVPSAQSTTSRLKDRFATVVRPKAVAQAYEPYPRKVAGGINVQFH